MKMKRIIYTLACLLLSVGAWAENVAKIGTQEYETLADAVAAVPTDGSATTITMLSDAELTATVTTTLGQNIVLDLNGKTITSTSTKTAIKNQGNLEVTGTGNIIVNSTTKTAYGINNSGGAALTNRANLVIGKNVTITAPCDAVYTKYGKTTINGTLANTLDGANNSYSTLAQSDGSEVIVAETAKITGVVNAIYGSKGTLEVNSTNVGKIYADGSGTSGLNIKKTTAIESLDIVGHAEFSDVEGYYVAAKAISGCTGTAKLLSDINGALAVSKDKTVTLDLNGHKVSTETTPIKVEGNLTITGEGTLQSTGMGSSTSVQAAAYVLNNGKLTILSGNYVAGYEGAEGNPAVYVRDNAVVEIKGGDFVGGSKFLLNKFDASRETSTIEVTGGTFHNNFNPADNTAEGEHTNFVADGYETVDNGDGTFTVKEKNYVAQVGEKKYESLAEAVEAAQNDETITLLANTTENVIIPTGKNITLDLNGKTLSGGSVATNDKKAAIVNNGTITIQDSSAEQTGTIKREDDDTGLSASDSYYVIDNHGTMTIKSGNIKNNSGLTTAHKGSSLIRNGEPDAAVLNIEGGTLTQNNFDVIKNGGKGTLNISGGTINSSNSYAVLSYSEMNMTTGTVNGNVCLRSYTDSKEDTHGVGNISGGTINGNITVETYTDNTPNTLSECNISGTAVINGTLSVGEGNGNTFTANDEKGTIAVSGGTFSSQVPEKYCAEGFSPVTTPNADGKYTVETTKVAMVGDVYYASLKDAIDAATDGATIKLIRDGLNYEYVEPNKTITLDLNGFAYDCNIDNYGTLTIVDNSEENTGKLVNTKKHWIVWNNPSAKLTVQSGTIAFETRANAKSDTGQQAIANEGSLIINGGTIDGYTADYNTGIADSYTDTYAVENIGGDVTINGGKLMGLHSLSTFGGTSAVINDGQFIVPFGPGTNAVYNYTDDLTVYIKGGTFIGDTDYLINKNDNSNGSFCITGGKFYKYDPQHSKSENPIANFVPKEYAAQKDADGYYVIVPAIAYIDEMGYAVLDIAIEEAKEAESATTITLLADAETEKETLPANVTIDANNKVLTMPSFVVLDGEAYTLPKITGAETYKVKKATYIRTNISATEWGTVCLPFSLTSGNGADYYTYNNISGSTLTVDEASAVEPNTPVVFQKAKGGDLEINQTDAIVSLDKTPSLATEALVGTYTATSIDANGSIYFINGDTFHKAQVSVKVPAYRAYINNSSSSGAKPDVLNLNVIGIGNADGIESVVMDATNTAEAIYDVNGRQLTAPQKGLNIMKLANGKTVKVMLK